LTLLKEERRISIENYRLFYKNFAETEYLLSLKLSLRNIKFHPDEELMFIFNYSYDTLKYKTAVQSLLDNLAWLLFLLLKVRKLV